MESPADRMYIAFQLTLGDEGRRNAMTRIWEVYEKRIYFFISRTLSGEGSSRDDCFQETMLRIFNNLGSYSVSRPLKPWIYRIAYNCCLDQLRKRRDEPIDECAEASSADRGGEEANVIRDELLCAIERAINGLESEDARMAYLRFFEEMKFGDIAKVVGMNEKTVKTRMESIKRRLRSELKGWL